MSKPKVSSREAVLHLRTSILKSMVEIEDIKNKMFHEIYPELDKEFHEDAYTNKNKLIYFNELLKTKIDQLNED